MIVSIVIAYDLKTHHHGALVMTTDSYQNNSKGLSRFMLTY